MAGKAAQDSLLCKLKPVPDNVPALITCWNCYKTERDVFVSLIGSTVFVHTRDGGLAQLEFCNNVTSVLLREDDAKRVNLWTSTVDGCVHFFLDLETIISSQSCTDENENDSEKDIFDDLTTTDQESRRLDVNDYVVLKLAGSVESLLIVDDLMVLLSEVDETSYLLKWYDVRALERHADKAERLHCYGSLGEVFVPRHRVSHRINACHPAVICCMSTEETEVKTDHSHKYPVSYDLYQDLFGEQNNPLDAKVILIGDRSGAVYAASLNPSAQRTARLIYDLEQPVVNVCAVRFEEEMTELQAIMARNRSDGVKKCNCVLIVGAEGKAARLFRDSYKKTTTFKQLFVASQVTCCKLLSSCLLLATRTELRVISVEEIQKARQHEHQECKGLKLFNVRALCTSPAELGTSVYVLCKSGQVLCKNVNLENLDSSMGTVRGTDFKELLTSIGFVSGNLKKIQDRLSKANHTLEELAVASTLVSQANSDLTGDAKLLPFKTDVSIRQLDLGSVQLCELVVRITNCRHARLTNRWSIVVKIAGQCGQDAEGSCDVPFPVNTVLVQACGPSVCVPGGFQEFHHRFSNDIVSKLPLTVTVFLSFSLRASGLQGKVAEEEQNCDSLSDSDCLTLPIHRSSINILWFLKPVSLRASNAPTESLQSAGKSVNVALARLALTRSTSWKMRKPQEPVGTETQTQHSTRIVVKETIAECVAGEGVSEMSLLQSLLQQSVSRTDVTQSLMRLDTADGFTVVLGVARSPTDEKCFDVQIQCPTLFHLCQLQTAISDKLAKHGDNCWRCTSEDARQVVQQVKDIEAEARRLQDATDADAADLDKISSQTVQLWLKLRSILSPI